MRPVDHPGIGVGHKVEVHGIHLVDLHHLQAPQHLSNVAHLPFQVHSSPEDGSRARMLQGRQSGLPSQPDVIALIPHVAPYAI